MQDIAKALTPAYLVDTLTLLFSQFGCKQNWSSPTGVRTFHGSFIFSCFYFPLFLIRALKVLFQVCLCANVGGYCLFIQQRSTEHCCIKCKLLLNVSIGLCLFYFSIRFINICLKLFPYYKQRAIGVCNFVLLTAIKKTIFCQNVYLVPLF